MHQWLPQEMVEVLEAVWTNEEQGSAATERIIATAKTEVSAELLATCERDGYLERHNGGDLRLTARGRQTAEEIIRRHRLAERLVVDVLGMTLEESEADACEFEHLLARGVTDAICTLLGHPRFCPHQHPIPPGACCQQLETQVNPLVTSLDRLDIGQLWTAAVEQERRALLDELLESVTVLPDHLVVKVHGAPALNVGLSEVGLKEPSHSEFRGVEGGT